MMTSKKGQGLSLNVIIIAALALIVLVVLIVIFTGRAAGTDEKLEDVSGDAALELTTMRLSYGKCKPSAADQNNFVTAFNSADGDVNAEESARSTFRDRIRVCKQFSGDQSDCEQEQCMWR